MPVVIIGILTIVSLSILLQKQLENNEILAIFAISILAILVFTVLLFNFIISKPVDRLIDRLRQSSVEGDLTQRMELSGNDEISVIAGYIDDFIDRVHTIVAQITSTSSEVVNSVTELNAVTTAVSEGALRQQQETGAGRLGGYPNVGYLGKCER